MYVCICNALTEEELLDIIKNNPNITMEDLRNTGIANNCYKCSAETEELLIKQKTQHDSANGRP